MPNLKKIPISCPYWIMASMPLFLLGIVFYVAMHYFSQGALDKAQTEQALFQIMFLRAAFSILFAMLLGFMGVKMTGHVWPAILVHCILVLGILTIDMSIAELVQDWEITLLIVATVGSITGIAGGLTLGIMWFRQRF